MEFAWRWSPHPDQRLSSLEQRQSSPAEIGTTTPLDFPQFLGPHRNSVVTTVTLDPNWTDQSATTAVAAFDGCRLLVLCGGQRNWGDDGTAR